MVSLVISSTVATSLVASPPFSPETFLVTLHGLFAGLCDNGARKRVISGEITSKLFEDIGRISIIDWKRNLSDKANSNAKIQARQVGSCQHHMIDACQGDMYSVELGACWCLSWIVR